MYFRNDSLIINRVDFIKKIEKFIENSNFNLDDLVSELIIKYKKWVVESESLKT